MNSREMEQRMGINNPRIVAPAAAGTIEDIIREWTAIEPTHATIIASEVRDQVPHFRHEMKMGQTPKQIATRMAALRLFD